MMHDCNRKEQLCIRSSKNGRKIAIKAPIKLMIFAVSTNKKKKKYILSRITIKCHRPHRSRRSSYVLIFVPDDVAGHESPTINYFKITFFITFCIRICLVQKPDQWSGSCMSCICVVGLSFNPFLALAIHSAADDRKQYQYQARGAMNHYFWNSIDAKKKVLAF